MAYVKKDKYVVRNNGKIQQEMLELLYSKEDVSMTKARDLVFYSVPMSKIRWAKWLNAEEICRFLVREDEYKIDTAYIEKEEDLGI
jgi:hypothetical protein